MIFVYYALIAVLLWSCFGSLVTAWRHQYWYILWLSMFFGNLAIALSSLVWLNMSLLWTRIVSLSPLLFLQLYKYFEKKKALIHGERVHVRDIIVWWRS